LKDEALDRSLWETGFRRGYGSPAVGDLETSRMGAPYIYIYE